MELPDQSNQGPRRTDPIERGALVVGIVVLALLFLWSVDGLQNGEFDAGQRLVWTAIAMGSCLAWLALLASLRSPDPLERLGFVPARLHIFVWGSLGVVALSHGADSLITWVAPEGSQGIQATRDALAFLPAGDLPFALAAIAGVTPLGEELFFRGLVQRGIARRGYPLLGLGLASLLFGAAHGDWLYGAAALSLGLALGLLLRRSGSLLPALAAHSINNFIAVLETSGWITLPAFLEAPPFGSLVGIGAGSLALWWALRAPPEASPRGGRPPPAHSP